MGSKLQPGSFDCYAAALPDEPMFVLLARDPLAPWLTAIWARLRDGDPASARAQLEEAIAEAQIWGNKPEFQKAAEAEQCAVDMMHWRHRNEGAWRSLKPGWGDLEPAPAEADAAPPKSSSPAPEAGGPGASRHTDAHPPAAPNASAPGAVLTSTGD